jgi:hypothetical protein
MSIRTLLPTGNQVSEPHGIRRVVGAAAGAIGDALASCLSTRLWDQRRPAFGVRREHAIGAMAAAATVVESQGEGTAAPYGSAQEAGEEPSGAGEHRPGRRCRQLPAGGPPRPRPTRSARRRHSRAGSSPTTERRPPPSTLCAWARRNSDQLGPIRRGAGPSARAAQHGRDRRRGDADPELRQLTLDAHVAPTRVLPR